MKASKRFERDDCDGSLDKAVAEAYDRMGPSPEAEDRMLAALQQCRSSASGSGGARSPSFGRAGNRTRGRAWRAAAPIAACLVLLAGAGALGTGALPMNAASSSSQTEGLDAATMPNGSDRATEERPGAGNGADAAGDEGAKSTDAGASDGDARCPFIDLADGASLRIAIGEDAAPLAADPALVGAEIERTRAYDGERRHSAPCTVSAYEGERPYAVSFDDGATWLLADLDASR